VYPSFSSLAFGGTLLAMTLNEFLESLNAAEPSADFGPALTGLWWDAKGD